jgi:superoxide dismutase, Cu-Zn family
MPRFRIVFAIAALAAAPALAQEEGASSAQASLIGAEGEEIGTAEFTSTPVGVLIRAELSGLPPGEHGFHIHETGACEPPFESAGGHYNPTDAQHGFLVEGGPHAGDMPNIHVPDSGELTIEVLNPFIRLEAGEIYDDDGSALLVHSGADDYQSQPSGDAGDRIACGVIEPS